MRLGWSPSRHTCFRSTSGNARTVVGSPGTANDNIQVPDPQNTVTVATHSRWAGGRGKLNGLASLAPKSLSPST